MPSEGKTLNSLLIIELYHKSLLFVYKLYRASHNLFQIGKFTAEYIYPVPL